MLAPGKMQEVATEILRYQINIAALQELRWKEQGEIDKGDFVLLYSGEPTQGKNGVGFIVDKKHKNNILDFKPINSRIAYIQIRAKPNNITIINIYAPTEDAEDEKKDEFYDKVEEIMKDVARHNVLIVLGDFNAQIGKERHNEKVAGKHTIHNNTNNNGLRACNLAANTNMIISSTKFEHKKQHKITWKHPDPTKKGSQIDHVFIRRRQQKSINDVRTYRGACTDTDHYMVVTTLKQKIQRKKTSKTIKIKWDTDKFKDVKIVQEYRNMFNKISEEENIQEKWKCIQKNIENAATQTIGRKKKDKRNDWFDIDCKKMIGSKREKRLAWIRSGKEDDKVEYNEIKRICNKLLRDKKKKWVNSKLNEIEKQRRSNDTKKFYKMVKNQETWKRSKVRGLKNKEGVIQYESNEINKIWIEHFSKQKENDGDHANTYIETDEQVDEPTEDEVVKVIKKIKNGKTPGKDGLNGELIKYGGHVLHKAIHELIKQIWKNENMPQEWSQGEIIPLYKKGDRQKVENYRGISLLSNAYKILSNILNNRLKRAIHGKIGNYQCGFTDGSSTTDALHRVRRIMDTAYEFGINLELLFVDYQQAFDSVNREKLVEAMRTLEVPNKIIRLISMTLNRTTAKVKTAEGETDEFEIKMGVRQGDVISATLFNIMLEYVIRKLKLQGTIVNRETQVIAYADDIIIISRSKKGLIETCRKLLHESKQVNLKVNESKTKYMKLQRRHKTTIKPLIIDKYTFEEVKTFRYLGIELDNQNKKEIDIAAKQQAGNKAYFSNQSLLNSQNITRSTKLRIYRTLIRPVIAYGGETMTMTKKM